MVLLLSTLGVGVASAILPFVNIEVYLAGVGVSHPGAYLAIAMMAALGHTAGKLVWYYAAYKGVETAWVQKKLNGPKVKPRFDKWVGLMAGRPWYGAAIMFLAAAVGIPPLLVMAAVGGALRMPLWVFVPAVFVGRALRFSAIVAGVTLALH